MSFRYDHYKARAAELEASVAKIHESTPAVTTDQQSAFVTLDTMLQLARRHDQHEGHHLYAECIFIGGITMAKRYIQTYGAAQLQQAC